MKKISHIIILLFLAHFGMAQCHDGTHGPFANQGWLSCAERAHPVQGEAPAHWIAYDLGEAYRLDSTYFWNYNVWGETGFGIKEYYIHHATIMGEWTKLGPFTMPQSPGSWKYAGSAGPVLDEVEARFLILTVASTWDATATCAGLAEAKIGYQFSVGVEEEGDFTVGLSPNPTRDVLRVSLPNNGSFQLELYNSVGYRIAQIDGVGSEHSLQVSHLAPGLYHIVAIRAEARQSESFVKVD